MPSLKQRQKRRTERLQSRTYARASFQVRAETLDTEARSVEAVLTTEAPVRMFDWDRGEVDEVLRMDGVDHGSQLPMLNSHARSTINDVIGSVHDIRREGDTLVGCLHFATTEDGQRAWDLVREGHLTDVSVGYRIEQAEFIKSGESQTIGGTTYTAAQRTMKVATAWTVREASLTPVGADQFAGVRGDITADIDELPPTVAEPPQERDDMSDKANAATGDEQRQNPPAAHQA